jgi:hypothetical protein
MSTFEPLSFWSRDANRECDELHHKIGALRVFMDTRIDEVDDTQKMLLAIQLSSMLAYHTVLVCRLACLGIKKEVVK